MDRAFRKSDTFLGLPVVDFEEVAARYPPASHQMFVAIGYTGMNAVRAAHHDVRRHKAIVADDRVMPDVIAGATILEDKEPDGVYPGTGARKSPQSSADVKP